MITSVYACPGKSLELVLKVVTRFCFEEDNTGFTQVAYLVVSVKVLCNSGFLIKNQRYLNL